MKTTSKFDVVVLVMVVLTVLVTPTQMAIFIKPGPEHTVSDIGLSLADVLLALTALVWGIGVIARGQLRQLRWPPAAAWVFLLLCVPSLFWTASMPQGAAKLAQYIEYFFVAYLVFVNTLATRRARIAVLAALLVGLAVNVFMAYRTYTTEAYSAAFPVHVAGLFGYRNDFGAYLCVLVPVAGALVLLAREIWLKVVGLLLLGAAVSVMLAGGPFLGLLLSLGVMVGWRAFRALPVYLLLVLALVLLILPALRYNNREILTKSLFMYNESGKDEDHRVEKRFLEWQAALKALDPAQQPYRTQMEYYRKVLLGQGIGMYDKEILRFWERMPRPDEDIMEHDTQNQYVVLAISVGFPAALAFIWLLASYGCQARRSLLNSEDDIDQTIAVGAVCAIVATSVAGLFGLIIVKGVGLVLVFLAAMAAAPKTSTR